MQASGIWEEESVCEKRKAIALKSRGNRKVKMGSYGKLAKRALETEMPVMVKVLFTKFIIVLSLVLILFFY